MHYQLPYDSDAFRFAVPAPAIAAAGEGAARTFSGLAYSGEVIRNHGPWSALVLDLDGCELLPVLLGHDRDRRVGLCTLAVREGVLWAEGRLLANPEAAALAADADAGFPRQLSVHAAPHHSDEIAPGLATQVNGRAQTGPLTVLRGIRIRELSFTPTAAHHRTGATVLDLTDEDSPMSTPSTPSTDELTAQVAALSARAEAAEAALAANQAAPQAAAPPADLIADLQGQIAALTARLEGAERAGLLLAAEADGRLIVGAPLHRYAEGLELAALRGLLATLTPIAALTATQTDGQAPDGAAFGAALAAEFGDEATYRAYQRAHGRGLVKHANLAPEE